MNKKQLQSFNQILPPQGTPLSVRSDGKSMMSPKNEKAVTPISHPNSTSSCSSGVDDDSNSISQSGNTATTRRQRSLSAHARTRQSQQANELKAAKSNMVARVQLGLIDMVNNSEVTAREKRIHPDESTYTLGDDKQAQEGSILMPAAADGQFRASPEAQQRRSKMLARGQGADKSKSAIFLQPCRSEEIEKQPLLQLQQSQLSVKKTRANQLPQVQSTVFQNLQKPLIGSQDFANFNAKSQQEILSTAAEFFAARQLAALQSTGSNGQMPESDCQRSDAQLQIQKTQEKLSQEDRNQQQKLATKASSFLFNSQSEERKTNQSQQKPRVPLRAVTAPTTVERQIKYLGLVIEKNEEQDLHEDDAWLYVRYRSQREELIAFESGYRNLEETCFVQRQYFPVRERYIRVVKKCRRRVIESFEKRGGRDFRRTRNALNAVFEREYRQNQEAQRLTRIQHSYH